MMRNSTPEQMQSGMDMWMKWSSKAGNAVVDLGTPLGKGKVVTKSGVSDAPIGVSGYSIIQAESIEALLPLLKDHPHFMSTGMVSIEAYECTPIM